MLQDFANLRTMITPLEDEWKTARPSASFHRSNEIGHQDIWVNLHWRQEVWAILFWMKVTSTVSANKNLDEERTQTLSCSNILVVYYCCISCLALLVGMASLSASMIGRWALPRSQLPLGTRLVSSWTDPQCYARLLLRRSRAAPVPYDLFD